MEKRSRRRIRDLVALSAFQGLSQNEIGCARISMMARSTNAPSGAGYRSARPITSRSSHSACNARPVHTNVPEAEVLLRRSPRGSALASTQAEALDGWWIGRVNLQRASPGASSGAGSMANALIVRETFLPSSRKTHRAAQYVRMSTDRQRYSIENQAAVIAAYAQAHNLSMVRTYRDEGESGIKLKNRAGLMRLLDDVQSDRADFEHILIYDVSRWGRFQDIDESAHYEFICKQAGIKVAYCAEEFDNDGSLISSIVKNIKRVMAAEFSRELSAKVHAGALRLARLGFKMGGPVGYGLQRLALLWQIYSRCCFSLICLLQYGHRCGRGRTMSSTMAWRTAGRLG